MGDQDIDLRPYSSPVQDQGSTGSCVANSLVKALEIKRIIKKGHVAHVDLSRLGLYYNARERMNPSEVKKDSGTYIAIACDCLRQFGVCRESLHPFSTTNLYRRPSDMAMREARLNRIKNHFKIKTQGNKLLDDIIFNLHAGNPVVFGTKVGEDWVSYRGGKEPLRVETRPKGGHCMCCLPGTMVITNKGPKEIQNITPGEMVLTRNGWNPVTITTERYTSEPVYEIHTQLSVKPLVVTGEHPILVRKAGVWDRVSRTDMNKFEFVKANSVKKRWYVKTIIDDIIERDLQISENFARLIGYYLGDGNLQIQKNKRGDKIKSIKFRLTYHRDDKKEIVEDIIKIIELEYPGTKYSIYEDKKSNTNIISFYNTSLGRRILELCGGANNKSAHKLLHLDPTLQLQIIKGWYKTDGCGRWLDTSKIFTASRHLAEGLVVMFQRCRLIYDVTYRKPYKSKIKGRMCNNVGGYDICFHSFKGRNRMYYDNNAIYSRISLINCYNYEGMVHNLEIANCHEYIANNILTHNCIVGFVDGLFIIENSWSKNWGDSGFGYVVPEVFKHASTRDFWVIVDGSEAWTEIK